MKLKQRVNYRPKFVFVVNLIVGLLFNFFSILFCLCSKFSNSNMEENKWKGAILGTISSTLIIICILCFRNSIWSGIGFLGVCFVIGIVIFLLIYHANFGKKAQEKAKIAEEEEKKYFQLSCVDKKLTNFINAVVSKNDEVFNNINDEGFIKNTILNIYQFFNPDEKEIIVKYFYTNNKNNAIIITLPTTNPVLNCGFKYKMLGFVDVGKVMRFFKVKNVLGIESLKKRENGYFYPHTYDMMINNISEFEDFLKEYTE